MEKLLALKSERAELIKESKEAYDKFLESKEVSDKDAYKAIEEKISEIEENIAEIERINEREASLIGKEIIDTKNKENKKVMEKQNKNKLIEKFLRNQLKEAELREDIVDTNGNAVVPVNLESEVVRKAYETSTIRQVADVRTVDHDSIVPVEDAMGSAGYTADGALPEVSLTLDSKKMEAHGFGVVVPVDKKMVDDENINLAELIIALALQKGVDLNEASYISTGTGTGRPKSIISDATAVNTAAAGTFTYADLKSLYYGVPSMCRKKGSWLFSDELIQIIHEFKDGNGNYIFDQNKPLEAIWGKPVYSTSHLDDEVATGNTIGLFGDFSKYRIVDRSNMTIKIEDTTGFPNWKYKVYLRTDGKLILSEAVAKLVVA